MSAAFDASYGQTGLVLASGTNLTLNPTAQINTGRKLIIAAYCDQTTPSPDPTFADNSTQSGSANVYTLDFKVTGTSTGSYYIYSCEVTRNILVTNVITFTTDATSTARRRAFRATGYTGLATSSAADTSSSGTGTGTAESSGNFTVTQADCLLVMWGGVNNATATINLGNDGQGDSWSAHSVTQMQGVAHTLQFSDIVNPNHGLVAYSGNQSTSGSATWAVLAGAYKALTTSVYTDSGTATIGFSGNSIADTKQDVDSDRSQVSFTPSAALTVQDVDSGRAQVNLTPSLTSEIYHSASPNVDDNIGGWVADVVVANPSGTHGSWTQNFNQAVPAGAFLVVSAHGSTALTFTMTDTGGNTYTRQITRSNGTYHSALYTCPVTNALTTSDTLHTGYTGASAVDIVIVASMYTGVSLPDTAADGSNDTIGTSMTLTGGATTAQAYEFLYASYVIDATAASNILTDNAWAKRTNIGTSDGARTMFVTDKDAYSTLTPSTSLHWTGSATCVGMLLPLKMSKLPSRMATTPALVEGGAPVETGTSSINFTPSFTEIPPHIESGTVNLTTTQTHSSEGKNLLPGDADTVNLTFDLTGSAESFVRTDFGTSRINFTQPFRQDLLTAADADTVLVVTLPGDATPGQGAFDSCLHLTLTPRWDSAPVGARWNGKSFVHFSTSTKKRWGSINVGKCPT